MTQVPMHSGEYVWPCEPDLWTPRIDDIAWHLSGIYRFNGLTRLTVAQHSWIVSENVPDKDKLWAILHDSPEAYWGDMAAPLKHSNTLWARQRRQAEERLMDRICDTFHLPREEPKSVRAADRRAVVTERRDLLPYDPQWATRPGWQGYADVEPFPERIETWSPELARTMFVARFAVLAQAGAAKVAA